MFPFTYYKLKANTNLKKQIWIWHNLGAFHLYFKRISNKSWNTLNFYFFFNFQYLIHLVIDFLSTLISNIQLKSWQCPFPIFIKTDSFPSHSISIINLQASASILSYPIFTDLLISKLLLFVNCTKHKTKSLL